MSAFKLSDLKLETQDDKTFIKLPNGDFLEFTLNESAMMIDLRTSLGGDSVDALRIPNLPHIQWNWNNLKRGETPKWLDFDGFVFHPVSKSDDGQGNITFERITEVFNEKDVDAWTVYGCQDDESIGADIALHDCATESEARSLIRYCNSELQNALLDSMKKKAVSQILKKLDSDEDAPEQLGEFINQAAREFNLSKSDIHAELEKHI